jgi:hypothetical protein
MFWGLRKGTVREQALLNETNPAKGHRNGVWDSKSHI